MKKIVCVLLALMLMFACAACEGTVSPGEPGDKFLGYWQADRASLEVTRAENGGYSCFIRWSSSAFDATIWRYTCNFDGEKLVSAPTGRRTELAYETDGKFKSETAVYTDGTAEFTMKGGKIAWKDDKDDAGSGLSFVLIRTLSVSPTAEEYADEYFRVGASYAPGTAGSSLAEAVAASKIVAFAHKYEFRYNDLVTLRSNMLAGYESLQENERQLFDGNFMSFVALIDGCFKDWAANKGRFEDAGVAAEMEALVNDADVRQDWERLKSNTFTMGNSIGG